MPVSIGSIPSSVLLAKLEDVLFTPSIYLQNCSFSIGDLSIKHVGSSSLFEYTALSLTL